MQGRIKFFWTILLFLSLLNSGCEYFSPTHPNHGLAIDQMHDVLLQGIKDDQNKNRLKKAKFHVPQVVSNALLPSTHRHGHYCIPQKRFDISANQMPAKIFFNSLVEGTPYNMVVNPTINTEISLNLKKVTIREALEAVQDAYGFEIERTSYGFEVLPPKIHTKIFTINYLDVKRKGKSLTELSSGQISEQIGTSQAGGGGSSYYPSNSTNTNQSTAISGSEVTTTSEADFWKQIEASLKQMIGNQNGRSVVVNSQSGIVIVQALHPELRQVTHFLNRIQTNIERQVILEAKVLEVQLNDQFQSGIDWNLFGHVIDGEGGVGQHGFREFTGTTLTDFNNIFTLRIKGNFGLLIKLLQTQGNVQILSSPRISAINNQKAVIKVGTDQFFVTGVSTTNTVSGTPYTNFPSQNINLTPFFSGVTLDVTPQISREGEVILHIHPTVSEVRDQEKRIILGNSGGTSNSQNAYVLPLAQSAIRESDNIVKAKSGQVIVIGGLMQNDMREEVAGVPLLSKIPFIGFMFRRTQQLSSKIELVILLRPILANNKSWRDQLYQADKTIDNMHRGFHSGGLPEVFGNEGECDA